MSQFSQQRGPRYDIGRHRGESLGPLTPQLLPPLPYLRDPPESIFCHFLGLSIADCVIERGILALSLTVPSERLKVLIFSLVSCLLGHKNKTEKGPHLVEFH